MLESKQPIHPKMQPMTQTSVLEIVLGSLKDQGDPLADAVISDYQDASEATRHLLNQGMTQGLVSIPHAPATFRQLLHKAEKNVSDMSAEALSRARAAYWVIDPIWISLSQGPGSLVHTYSDPGIAAVLTATGRLSESGAARRLLETLIWNISILRPDGLVIGGKGYVRTLQVRLLHARIRSSLIEKGWTVSGGGVPIDQWQMIRTWLDFTVVAFRSLTRVGFEFNHEQHHAILEMWQLVGRLLGIDDRVMSLLKSTQDAEGWLARMDAVAPQPTEQSKSLTRHALNAVGTRLAKAWDIPTDVAILFAESLCRLFHGETLADQLGLSPNWTAALLPAQADANRYRMWRAAQDESFKRALMERNQKGFDAIEGSLGGSAAFEQFSQVS